MILGQERVKRRNHLLSWVSKYKQDLAILFHAILGFRSRTRHRMVTSRNFGQLEFAMRFSLTKNCIEMPVVIERSCFS